MKTAKLLALALGVAGIFSACSSKNEDDPTGAWKSAAPINITADVNGATSASKTLTFDFKAPNADGVGQVVLTADYDVTAPVVTEDSTTEVKYQVSASVNGTWKREKKDSDDLLLTFDQNTLEVNGVDAPELGPVTNEFLTSLAQYTSLDDVEVSKDKTTLSLETDHPDMKYQFVRK